MAWHMLHFSDLQRLAIPKQFLAFSDAYLESTEILCTNLCEREAETTYAHGAVILSLTFHGCELFLKAAILYRAPDEQFSGNSGHSLEHLNRRYTKLYPGRAWALDLPFRRDEMNFDGIDPRVADELKQLTRERDKSMPQDQLHRYPTDVQGQPWDAAFGFEPNSFRRDIMRIRVDFERVKRALPGG